MRNNVYLGLNYEDKCLYQDVYNLRLLGKFWIEKKLGAAKPKGLKWSSLLTRWCSKNQTISSIWVCVYIHWL
jgi:hypothetical protein